MMDGFGILFKCRQGQPESYHRSRESKRAGAHLCRDCFKGIRPKSKRCATFAAEVPDHSGVWFLEATLKAHNFYNCVFPVAFCFTGGHKKRRGNHNELKGAACKTRKIT